MARRRPVALLVLTTTGIRTIVPFVIVGVLIAIFYPDGMIRQVGPLSLQPAVAVIMFVPMILAVACALAHVPWPTPVVRRNARTHLARAASYVLAFALGLAVLRLIEHFATYGADGGPLRNLLWLTGVCLAAGSLAGIAYAWVPAVIAYACVLLSPAGDDPWTLNGWLFHESATDGQLALAAAIFAVGLTLAIWDPRSAGYLPRAVRPVTRVTA